jgi:hypothetical protein
MMSECFVRARRLDFRLRQCVWFASVILMPVTATVAAAADYKDQLSLQGITFDVSATHAGATTKLTITPSGLKAVNDPVTHEIDGRVVRAEVADIDANGDPEIYVFTVSNSDQLGGVIAYSTNNKKSMSQIYVPAIADDAKNNVGYVGGDESAIVENTLVTRFKIYNGYGSEYRPTGKWRQLQYKLRPGEAGWKMILDQVVEF